MQRLHPWDDGLPGSVHRHHPVPERNDVHQRPVRRLHSRNDGLLHPVRPERPVPDGSDVQLGGHMPGQQHLQRDCLVPRGQGLRERKLCERMWLGGHRLRERTDLQWRRLLDGAVQRDDALPDGLPVQRADLPVATG